MENDKNMEETSVNSQRELDRVTQRMQDADKLISLHNIYCDCEICASYRAIQKENRDKPHGQD